VENDVFVSDLGVVTVVFDQLRQLKDDDVLKHCVVDAKEVPVDGTLKNQTRRRSPNRT
jgi:hypothetical protein